MEKEPTSIIGLIVAAVTSVLGLLVAFGVPLTTEQRVAILACVAPMGAIVQLVWTRGRVFSPASAKVLLALPASASGDPGAVLAVLREAGK